VKERERKKRVPHKSIHISEVLNIKSSVWLVCLLSSKEMEREIQKGRKIERSEEKRKMFPVVPTGITASTLVSVTTKLMCCVPAVTSHFFVHWEKKTGVGK
jgi:hypothetical protein